jgi:HlyD family secretion protein
MKPYNYLLALTVFLAGCAGNDQKSDAYGNFEAQEVIVSAESPGKVLELNLEEGQFLEAGTLIGFIDTVDLDLKRKQLIVSRDVVLSRISNVDAQIAVQQQQQDNLMVDKKRLENLLKDGAATQKQLDDINGALLLIAKQIESLVTQQRVIRNEAGAYDVQIEQVDEQIRKCYIRNPIDGTVLTKYVEASELVSPGKPIYKEADLRMLELKVYISGDQLPEVKLGQKVEVLVDRDKKTNQSLTGTVSWISAQAEFTPKIVQTKEERVNLVYAMKVLVDNDGSLKIGMPGEVNFKSKE